MNVPIVIAAYNRDHTLVRLLSSLSKAQYDNPVKLIISIDGGGPEGVKTAARDFEWGFGAKEVIEHPENLGLRKHILYCGGLSQQYDGIILLEDDLYVSPWFYEYAQAALSCYRDCSRISGISLYSYRHNETSLLPFMPLSDASDTFFMQLPCSWGQAWLKEHWRDFMRWYDDNCEYSFSDDPSLPANIAGWPATSWKKYFAKYMIEKGKYFVFPYNSYTTNFGDKGQHHQGSSLYQVPIVFGKKSTFYFKNFDDSLIKYDAFCEILPEYFDMLCYGNFNFGDCCIDLHGTKKLENCSNEYVLTTKKSSEPISTFARVMMPIEVNVISGIDGDEICLSKTSDVEHVENIADYIWNKAISAKEQNYYFNSDTLHHSLLFRSEAKVTELYQAYREASRSLASFHSSLSWRLTAPLRKLLDMFRT